MLPLKRAQLCLEGLSVGDAFGERFVVSRHVAQTMVERRWVPPGPWPYTDDTVMAHALVEHLEESGQIDQDRLAQRFGARYRREPRRGYGGTAQAILEKINLGVPWREAASEAFGGEGSMGNGAAMRVGPLGAYFADGDDAVVVEQARRSAHVTHAHPDAQAGAIAVAVSAAWLWRTRESKAPIDQLFDFVLELTPEGATRAGVIEARRWPRDATPTSAARALGSGQKVLSSDTVPFCLWCVARHPEDYREALWTAVAGRGDTDTTCAIVGGLVALRGSVIPSEWLAARERLS